MSQELELDKVIDTIFSKEPQPKFSIQLQFDTSDIKELFEAMLMVTTQGMRLLFGTPEGKVNLGDLKKKDILKFNQYMNSFGMSIFINTENYNPLKDYESLKYNKQNITSSTELKSLEFPMLQPNGIVYIISFDFLRDYS